MNRGHLTTRDGLTIGANIGVLFLSTTLRDTIVHDLR